MSNLFFHRFKTYFFFLEILNTGHGFALKSKFLTAALPKKAEAMWQSTWNQNTTTNRNLTTTAVKERPEMAGLAEQHPRKVGYVFSTRTPTRPSN